MISDAFVVGSILGEILKKGGLFFFIFWKNVKDVLLSFVYLSLICILLSDVY